MARPLMSCVLVYTLAAIPPNPCHALCIRFTTALHTADLVCPYGPRTDGSQPSCAGAAGLEVAEPLAGGPLWLILCSHDFHHLVAGCRLPQRLHQNLRHLRTHPGLLLYVHACTMRMPEGRVPNAEHSKSAAGFKILKQGVVEAEGGDLRLSAIWCKRASRGFSQ